MTHVKVLQAKKRIVDTLQIYMVNDKNYQIYLLSKFTDLVNLR